MKIDYIGLGLLSVGLGFLQMVLDKGEREDWFGSNFIIGVLGRGAGRAWSERCCGNSTARIPIVDFRMLKDRNFALATVTMFMLGFVLYGSTVLLPLLLQTLLGYTALLSGLVLSPGGLWSLLALPHRGPPDPEGGGALAGGDRARASPGSRCCTWPTSTCRLISAPPSWLGPSPRLGMAFLFIPINVMAFYFIPKEKMNNATGIINLARNIGGSVGIANVATLLARRAQVHQAMLVSHLTPLDPAYRNALQGASQLLMTQGSNSSLAHLQAQGLVYGNLVRQANMLAYVDTFWLLGCTFLAMIPFMFLMRSAKPHGSGPVAAH